MVSFEGSFKWVSRYRSLPPDVVWSEAPNVNAAIGLLGSKLKCHRVPFSFLYVDDAKLIVDMFLCSMDEAER